MQTNTVNLRDVQQLHDGINLAIDALRRITPTAIDATTVQAFGTPMAFDPFGVTRASLEHAAYNSRLGWGANPMFNNVGFGFGVQPGYNLQQSYMSPIGIDPWTRGLQHSAFGTVTNPMLGAVSAIHPLTGMPTSVAGISPLGTLGVPGLGTTVAPTFGAVPYVPFRTW